MGFSSRPVLLGICLAAALCQALPADAQEVTLDVHHFLSPKAPPQTLLMEPWAKRVEEQSKGRIAIDIYPDMSLGGRPQELYESVVEGNVDIVWTLAGYTPARFPHAEVFELPFVHQSDAVATNLAIQDLFDDYLAADFSEVHPLLIHVHAGQAFYTANGTIRSLEDLKGQRLRTPSRPISWMLEAMGAESIGMPLPALPLALDKDIVDGAMIPYEIFPAMRFEKPITAITVGHDDTRFGTAVFVFAMNKQVYENLPPDLQKVIDDNSGSRIAEDIGRGWMQIEDKVAGLIRSKSVEMIELSPEETDRLQQASEPVIDRWIDDMESRGIDGRELVQVAREAISRHQ
ncbi:MAG: TRAP transporter substrate-binding protein [Rhizobiales bacterium]|nr:TRAP transporter substrate-binding protein [Hyphomicrobiales bacterium]